MSKTYDLSEFVAGMHLMGYECLPVRLLRQLRAAMYMPGRPKLEFMTHSQTNPKKVSCIYCWEEKLQ